MDVFRTKTKKIMKKIRELSGKDKMLVGDSKFHKGTKKKHQDKEGMFAVSSRTDVERLKKYKSRVRCRLETFNGRIKNFGLLANRFRGKEENHKHAFEAICVMVQYQMDNGSPIFSAK